MGHPGCCGKACDGKCTCCPFGCTYAIPIIMTTIATGLTYCAVISCHYFQSTYEFGVDLDGVPDLTQRSLEFGVGPWLVQDFKIGTENGNLGLVTEDCVSWLDHTYLDADDIDGPMVFARFMTMISLVASFVLYFTFLCGACLPLAKTLLKTISILFMVLGALMMLSLVSLASDWCADADDCSLNFGGGCAITSFFFWIFASIAICFMREPIGPVDERPQQQQQELEMATTRPAGTGTPEIVEQTIVEADGTVVKVVRTTTRLADGTENVQQTREVIQANKGAQQPVAAVAMASATFDQEYPEAVAKAI